MHCVCVFARALQVSADWYGKIGMDLGSSDDGTEIALEGSAFPQALLDADVIHGHYVGNQSVSSAECLDMHDDFDGLDGLDGLDL